MVQLARMMALRVQPLLLQPPLCWLWLQGKQARALLLAAVVQQQQLAHHITLSMVMFVRSLCRSCACCCIAAASKVGMSWTTPLRG
jgi:hypothetical protein